MIDSPRQAFLKEFKAQPKWLVWRTEKRGKGAPTKVPYSAKGGTGSSTNPETWSSYEEASAVAARYDGLGFAIADGHVLIDLDGCRDPQTGIIEKWARFVVEFLQCPTEISPSGAGLHIYVKSRNARSLKRMFSKAGEKKQGIEIYAGGRYSAITFNHLPGTPLEVPEVDLDPFLKFVAQGDFDPADRRIEASCKRWEQDSRSAYTHTRAPLNLEQWTSTFRVDILKRKPDGTLLIACPGSHGEYDKRDGLAFLKQLPSGALAMGCLHQSCSLSNSNGNRWREFRQMVEGPRIKGDQNQSHAALPASAESRDLIIEQRPEVTELDGPDGLHLTSMGNAERFLRDYREDILWVEGPTINRSGTFYYWGAQRWQADNAQAMRLAKQTVSDLKQLVASAIEAGQKSDVVKALVSFWRSCENDHKVAEILSLARWNLVIKQGEFDANPDLLGVRNGVVDLRTGAFRETLREDRITKHCNAAFDENATCPQWEKFLLETAQDDLALIGYLQQCAGISLTGHVKEHLFFIVVGPGGTGKSTFCEAIKYVWGDYAIGIDPNSLASMKSEGGRARPDIARLPGVRLAFANETRKGLQLDVGLVKALTGDDTVQARHLYQAEFDFKPTHKLWLRTNEEPQFDGADTGMQRRVRKIPFVHKVKESKPEDVNLPEKLRGEASGILNWAIRGLLAYQKHGLTEPAIVQQETAEYIKSLDIMAQFIEEECEAAPSFKQPAGELYQRYRTWIEGRGQKAMGQPRFRTDLQAKGYQHGVETGNARLWRGIRLRANAQ